VPRTGTALLGAAVPALLGLQLLTAPSAVAASPSSGSPTSAQTSRPAASRSTSVPAGVTPHQWSRVHALTRALRTLRMCESGGRYTINTGNGYYGAYQFLPSTWHSLGYGGLPNHATPAVQDAAAARLHDRRGSWADWGTCGRRAARLHS
jgi:hypothetical protein